MAKNHITFDLRALKQALLDGLADTIMFGRDSTDIAELKRGKHQKARRWLKGQEVRNLLGITAHELQEMRDNGSLPYKRDFGRYLYDYQTIMDLVAAAPIPPARKSGSWGNTSKPSAA